MAKRIIIFSLFLVVLYLASIYILVNLEIDDKPVLRIATRNPVIPGNLGFAAQKFQEINNYTNLDIVFLGSSHAYRTFSPQIYAEYDLKTFNMGTTGQTPLNSYFLLKSYFDQLKPKLVVLELYYGVLERDGLESFYDLIVNIPFRREFIEMALAIKSPHAINEAIGSLISSMEHSGNIVQHKRTGEAYVGQGFVSFTNLHKPGFYPIKKANFTNTSKKKRVVLRKDQLKYLKKIAQFARSRGSKLLFVTQPMPQYTLDTIQNYDEVSNSLHQLADEIEVTYLDFNKLNIGLDEDRHFYDGEYLNAKGIEILNHYIVKEISQLRLL